MEPLSFAAVLGVVVWILHPAVSGIVEDSAVSVKNKVRRKLRGGSRPQPPPRKEKVRATARWEVNRHYVDVLPPDPQPSSETFVPGGGWHLVDEQGPHRYAIWSQTEVNGGEPTVQRTPVALG